MKGPQVGGFRFAGIHCGIKKQGALDLALIVADEPAPCAGVFTTNQIVAAPVVQSRERLLKSPRARAIVINSGNANACTGLQGERDAEQMAQTLAESLHCHPRDIQVCSTGVIGAPLPMDVVTAGIQNATNALTDHGLDAAAQAICTTDTFPKMREMTVTIGDRTIRAAGISKGAGMIHPNMATMLGFVVTDAPIHDDELQSLWVRICQKSFNAITIDGDTSTNDTALLMASGAVGGPHLTGSELNAFESALLEMTAELAKDIVRDAEGGTKVVDIQVTGAEDIDAAKTVANTIALSPLVKTAIHGEDPNWGRIIAAAGRSGVRLDPHALRLKMNEVVLYEKGQWLGTAAEKEACAVMRTPEYQISLDLGAGPAKHSVYTCDFSADYVRINADYRS